MPRGTPLDRYPRRTQVMTACEVVERYADNWNIMEEIEELPVTAMVQEAGVLTPIRNERTRRTGE